jgi:hypothetical protein
MQISSIEFTEKLIPELTLIDHKNCISEIIFFDFKKSMPKPLIKLNQKYAFGEA